MTTRTETAAGTAQGRLAMWADDDFQRVELRGALDLDGPARPVRWYAEAEARPYPTQGGLRVRVETGPCPDPETACQNLIERLALAGVVIPPGSDWDPRRSGEPGT